MHSQDAQSRSLSLGALSSEVATNRPNRSLVDHSAESEWIARAPSYQQWLDANRAHSCVAKMEISTCVQSNTSAIRSRIRGGFDDAATPDLSVWLCVDGVRRGRWDIGLGWRDFEMRPGQFMVAPADRPILLEADGEVEFVGVAFPLARTLARLESMGISPSEQFGTLHNAVLDDPQVRALVLDVHQDMLGGGQTGRLFLESLQAALVARLWKITGLARALPTSRRRSSLTPSQVDRVRAYVLEHITGSIGIEDLSRLVHLSPAHFSRLFKLATGHAPHEFVTRQRVALAQDMLRGSRGDMTISEVAVTAGFCDQSHMARHFRRVVGVSPACWRTTR
jgi:AraC family transcriptional regulator